MSALRGGTKRLVRSNAAEADGLRSRLSPHLRQDRRLAGGPRRAGSLAPKAIALYEELREALPGAGTE